MAFQDPASLINLEGFGVSPRAEPAGDWPRLHTRNDTTGTNSTYPTVNLFIDDDGSSAWKYVASVVTACADQTVYALQCTAGPTSTYIAGNYFTEVCDSTKVVTVTEGPSHYIQSLSTELAVGGTEVTLVATDNCALSGTTAAVCTTAATASAGRTTTSSTTASTYSGTSFGRYDVPITAGAEKTANPTGTCAPSSAASGLNTKGLAVWALASVVGAVGFLTAV
ncbi:hypothetical protein SCARD494_01755 [Seiridium cardinale]